MSGKLKSPGTMRIEDITYQLLPSESGQGWSYEYKTIATTPQQTSPEEQLLGSAPVGYKRTIGWMDWSNGGVGADIYQPPVKYLSYSEGPQTELSRKITRPLEKRRASLPAAKGRVVDFFEFPFHDGSVGLYLVQETGIVRRIYTSLNSETIAAQLTAEGAASGNGTGVNMGTRQFTEASQPWTYGLTNGETATAVLIGSMAHPLVRAIEGATAGSLVWQQDVSESSGGANHNPVQFTHFTNGVYSNNEVGGEYLWASSAPNFIPNVGGTRTKQALWPLVQEQDPFVWDNWVAEIAPIGLDPDVDYITGIAALREYIIVTTSAGTIYQVSTGTNGGVPAPILDRRGATPDPDSGRTMRVWNGRLFIPTPRGLYVWIEFNGQTGGTLMSVGPESIPGNNSPIRGHCVIYTGDNDWLYAAFWNGTDSYIMKGKIPASTNEQTDLRMIWHAACPYIPNERVTSLHVTSPAASTNPILCIGTESNTGGGGLTPAVHFVTLPRPGKTVLNDENLRFDVTDKAAILPDHDALLANVKKTFMRVTITSNNVSKRNPLYLYARIDEGQWQRMGRVQESPIANIPLARNFNGYKIGLKLVFGSYENPDTVPPIVADVTTCPYIQSVAVDYVPHLPAAKVANCTVFVAQNQITVSGHNQYSGSNRLSLLETFKDSNRLLTFTGPDGITRQGQFDKTVGIGWVWSDQATPDTLGGFKAQFTLNIYDDFVYQAAALYEVSHYTEGSYVSYYDETG